MGSFINQMYARGTKGQPTPIIGMGATLLYYTDRDAGTIVFIGGSVGKVVVGVQADRARRIDTNGQSESQAYEFTRNLDGGISYFRFDAKKGWRGVQVNPDTDRWVLSGGTTGLRIGERDKYYDFSF